MRYPGITLAANQAPALPLLQFVARQLRLDPDEWVHYATRDQTRREHLVELQNVFGFQPFTMRHYKPAVHSLDELAWQTDKGIVLAKSLIHGLRKKLILLPSINVIERICAEAITRARRRTYKALTEPLSETHFQRLEALLTVRENSMATTLAWLRQPPGGPNAKHLLEHLDRLKAILDFDLPTGLDKAVHQNRLLKLAREGRQMRAQDLGKFESNRR
jgi:hypothetical protein